MGSFKVGDPKEPKCQKIQQRIISHNTGIETNAMNYNVRRGTWSYNDELTTAIV
jgi:hypothetical protein